MFGEVVHGGNSDSGRWHNMALVGSTSRVLCRPVRVFFDQSERYFKYTHFPKISTSPISKKKLFLKKTEKQERTKLH